MRDLERIIEKVKKRKDHLQELFKKDEENYDLWAGKKVIFDTHPMAVNIMGGEMIALSSKTQASLNRSRLDIHVLPPNPLPNDDAEDTANREEDMYYFGLAQADERLANIGEASLLSSATWDVTNLGRVPVRVLVYNDKEEKRVIWDILPMNPRFLTFSFDSKGLAWYCYETFRSPDSIKEEYGKEVVEDIQGKGISVSDYWDREHNVRYLTKSEERLGKVWKHPFKDVPAIIQPVAGGPKAITSEGINVVAWGQSIFDHVKILFRDLNKMRTITATHAHILAKNPTEIIYEDGTTPNIEEEHFEFHAGSKIKHARSVEFKPMKQNDIPDSHMAMMGDISASIEKATFAELNPDKPAHSGAALRILGQDKQDVLTPRMEALNIMFTRICKMTKKQIVAQKLTIPVQTVSNGVYKTYEMVPELLDNDFYVNAELVRQDVYDEVEALQRAQMFLQLGLKSRRKVMEEVLLEKDVPNQIAEINIEQVEDAIPELKLPDVIQAYRKKELPDKAAMLEQKLALMELEQQQGVTPPEGQPPGQPPGMPPSGQPPMRPPVPGVPR